MDYKGEEVIIAHTIYSKLMCNRDVAIEDIKEYYREEKVEDLVNQFARLDDATVILAGERAYLIPIATTSPRHMSNEMIKKLYLSNGATNLDIYLMYTTIIILLGEFYNSYQTQEPTIDFITVEEWLEAVNTHLESLKQLDEESLKQVEEDQEYNWTRLLEKWFDMDDIKEKAKKQSGNTISRISFLNTVKNFLEKQDMIRDIGNSELELTEKTKIIVQRYYMDYEFNRGILDFLYQFDKEEEDTHGENF